MSWQGPRLSLARQQVLMVLLSSSMTLTQQLMLPSSMTLAFIISFAIHPLSSLLQLSYHRLRLLLSMAYRV